MSRPTKRGKLRNPPRGRQYAMVAVAIVVLVAGGSGAYLYASHSFGIFPAPSTTTSSSSGTGSTPCSSSTTTSSSGRAAGTYALICTNLGLIEAQLSSSPQTTKTVANFVSLAQSGFFDGLVWHRIVPGFVIQTGDPLTKNGLGDRTKWGTGTSSNTIPLEIDSTLHNTAGTLAMAAPSNGLASSQFFISLADNSQSLDSRYAVFGNVISGMSVVQAIAKVPIITDQNSPEYSQPVTPSQATIVSVTIQTSP